MDGALEAALRLFTDAIEQAGQDCGGLAARGAPPQGVAPLLTTSVTYAGKDGPEFLSFSLTKDFKGFTHQPNCRLFFIVNSASILEMANSDLRAQIALNQVPSALVDAHIMKCWLGYVERIGDAMRDGNEKGLIGLFHAMVAEIVEVGRRAPAWIARQIDVDSRVQEWRSGLPAVSGRQLTADVKRIGGLPMTDFIAGMINDFLVEAQVQGIQARAAAG